MCYYTSKRWRFFIAGYSSSTNSGEKTSYNRGGYDYWIIKIDKYGNKVWDRTCGGESNDCAYAITATPDGGCVVAGYSHSPESYDKTSYNRGNKDYWIVKLDKDGNKVWDKTYGGNAADTSYAIKAISSGGYIVVGSSYSTNSYDKTETGRGIQDYWIVRLDSNGNKVWDKTYGGSLNDFCKATVAASDDGGYIAAGFSSSTNGYDKTENSRGGFDYWIIKFGENGLISFSTNNYVVNEADGYCNITLTRTNGIFGTGTVYFSTFNGSAIAGVDYVATNGVISWANEETSKVVRIEIINRHGVVGNRPFEFLISDANGVGLGKIKSGVVNIVVGAPEVVSGVNVSKGVYTNKISVNWNNDQNATGYEVWRGVSDEVSSASKIAIVAANSYADYEVNENITYYYWIRATNIVGTSAFSASDYGYKGVKDPIVYINGKVGEVHVGTMEPVTIGVQMMNLVDYLGIGVDWWCVAYSRGMGK